MDYIFQILTLGCIYLILGLSLNIVVGYSGILSLCHASWFGLGAYTTAVLCTKFRITMILSIPFGILFTGFIAFMVAHVLVRLRKEYAVVTTIGFQALTFSVLYNWSSFTGGALGISGISRPSFIGIMITEPYAFLLFTIVVTGVSSVSMWLLYRSPFGCSLQSIREDEIAAVSLGKNTLQFKIAAVVIGAMYASIAGSLFASYVTYIDPTSFSLDESLFITTALIVGGTGNIKGPIIGVLFMIGLPEILRFFQVPQSMAANLRQIIFGTALVLVMLLRPRGIAGRYAYD